MVLRTGKTLIIYGITLSNSLCNVEGYDIKVVDDDVVEMEIFCMVAFNVLYFVDLVIQEKEIVQNY